MRLRAAYVFIVYFVLMTSCTLAPMSTANDESSSPNPYQIINNNLKASPEQCAPNGVTPWDILFDNVCISIQSILLKTNLSQNDNGLYSEIWVNGLLFNDSSESILVDLQPQLTNPDGTSWQLYNNWNNSTKYLAANSEPENGVYSLGPDNSWGLYIRFFSDEISPSPEGYTLTFTARGVTVTYELDARLP